MIGRGLFLVMLLIVLAIGEWFGLVPSLYGKVYKRMRQSWSRAFRSKRRF